MFEGWRATLEANRMQTGQNKSDAFYRLERKTPSKRVATKLKPNSKYLSPPSCIIRSNTKQNTTYL